MSIVVIMVTRYDPFLRLMNAVGLKGNRMVNSKILMRSLILLRGQPKDMTPNWQKLWIFHILTTPQIKLALQRYKYKFSCFWSCNDNSWLHNLRHPKMKWKVFFILTYQVFFARFMTIIMHFVLSILLLK